MHFVVSSFPSSFYYFLEKGHKNPWNNTSFCKTWLIIGSRYYLWEDFAGKSLNPPNSLGILPFKWKPLDKRMHSHFTNRHRPHINSIWWLPFHFDLHNICSLQLMPIWCMYIPSFKVVVSPLVIDGYSFEIPPIC